MNRPRIVAFAFMVIAALALLLAACTQPPALPPASQADVEKSAGALIDDLTAISAALQADSSFGAALALPSGAPLTPGSGPEPDPGPGPFGGLIPLAHADADLTRGTFTHDPTTGEWVESTNAEDDLVLRWTFTDDDGGEHDAELTVDWDVVGATEVVNAGFGLIEVPTDMIASLTVDGDVVASLGLKASWYDAVACGGPILEPTSLDLTTSIGDPSARLEVSVSFDLDESSGGDATVRTSGSVVTTTGGDTTSISWDLSATGALVRSVESCAVESFTVTSGSVELGVASTIEGESRSGDVAFGFDDLVLDEFGEPVSVDLLAGSVDIDNVEVMTFSGTLDDTNADGYPGENVTLVFANDDTTTLDAFLKRLAMTTAVRRVAALLGR